MMRAGTFREDLYYRLQVIELWIPPLRERREEIPPLVEFFLVKYTKLYRRPQPRPSRMLSDALVEYQWPGNIRELENMMKRLVVLQEEKLILDELARLRQIPLAMPPDTLRNAVPATAPSAPAAAPLPPPSPDPIEAAAPINDEPALPPQDEDGIDLQAVARTAAKRAERVAIEQALDRFRWNRRKAAEYLKVSYKTLLNKMKECGISDADAT
jgi:two-component system, NtrC family, response regulator AtoC